MLQLTLLILLKKRKQMPSVLEETACHNKAYGGLLVLFQWVKPIWFEGFRGILGTCQQIRL